MDIHRSQFRIWIHELHCPGTASWLLFLCYKIIFRSEYGYFCFHVIIIEGLQSI